MNRPASIKYTPKLVLTAVLSGGLTIGVSAVYILLCLACIAFRFNCDHGSTNTNPADFFWNSVFKVYIQSSSCKNETNISDTSCEDETGTYIPGKSCIYRTETIDYDIMEDLTVVILASVTLSISILCLAAAITLVSIIQDDSKSRFIGWAVYAHIACCVASLIVDLTTAVFFGIDYANLTETMANTPLEFLFINIYDLEVKRQGAFWLMTIALKGYIPHIISCALLILLVVYLVDFQNAVKNDEHSIHKVGVLNAFDSSRKPDDNWSQSDILYNNTQFMRGPQMNNGFIEDDSSQRSPRRLEPPRSDYYSTKPQMNSGFIEDDSSQRSPRRLDPPRSDYYSTNRSFDRSDSWHHTQNNDPQGSRLFSYLDDIKRPALTKPPASPAVENDSPWRRDPWQSQTPSVPAPDYSPNQPRRLKSALKSQYM